MGWNEAVDAILSLKDFATNIIKVVLKILQIFPKFLSLFTDFTDPVKVIKDSVFSVKTGIFMILDAIFGDIIRLITKPFVEIYKHKKVNQKSVTCFRKSIINVILLVLCPPLAILAKNGIKDIFYIIIASVLTYFYYFPGLIYSSLYIL